MKLIEELVIHFITSLLVLFCERLLMLMKPLLESVVTRYVCLGKSMSNQIIPIFNKMDTGRNGIIVSGINSGKILGKSVEDSLGQKGVDLSSFTVQSGTVDEAKELRELVTFLERLLGFVEFVFQGF